MARVDSGRRLGNGESMNNDKRDAAWWSKAVLIGAIVAAALLPIGALGTRLGVWPVPIGLMLVAAGALLAVVAVVLGIVALIAVVRTGRTADRPLLYIGLLVGGAVMVLLGPQFNTARSVPPIHNISTDIVDPPQFDAVVELRGPGTNPLEYDAAKLAPLQQAAYPGVKPLTSELDVAASFDRALEVLAGMGLEIVNADRDAGRIEATATTFWFGFKDDLVVRIRAADGGSIIDLRSVSRVGMSDVGINAKRIEEFMTRFSAA
jgi:uncharacterized protein (DUF1499 family)